MFSEVLVKSILQDKQIGVRIHEKELNSLKLLYIEKRFMENKTLGKVVFGFYPKREN